MSVSDWVAVITGAGTFLLTLALLVQSRGNWQGRREVGEANLSTRIKALEDAKFVTDHDIVMRERTWKAEDETLMEVVKTEARHVARNVINDELGKRQTVSLERYAAEHREVTRRLDVIEKRQNR